MNGIEGALCEEGRPVAVAFNFPPQLRVEGDLEATTVVIVQTALAYTVATLPEFKVFCAALADEDLAGSAWDDRMQEMFARLTREDLYQFFAAVDLPDRKPCLECGRWPHHPACAAQDEERP